MRPPVWSVDRGSPVRLSLPEPSCPRSAGELSGLGRVLVHHNHGLEGTGPVLRLVGPEWSAQPSLPPPTYFPCRWPWRASCWRIAPARRARRELLASWLRGTGTGGGVMSIWPPERAPAWAPTGTPEPGRSRTGTDERPDDNGRCRPNPDEAGRALLSLNQD